jgi:hypothetical protein
MNRFLLYLYSIAFAGVCILARADELASRFQSPPPEVRLRPAGENPMVRHAAAVRFDFGDWFLGFNVYREFVITGKAAQK